MHDADGDVRDRCGRWARWVRSVRLVRGSHSCRRVSALAVAAGVFSTSPATLAQPQPQPPTPTVVVAPGHGETRAHVACNGATVVDIAPANAAGLSHNRYDSFHVDARGLVLNNAGSAPAPSRLAGAIAANATLGVPATVILNEVVGTARSRLEGAIEVHGGKADLILANPQGIGCTGCDFVNTDRVTLTTGVAQAIAGETALAFAVRQGDIDIRDLKAKAQKQLDLIARTVRIRGASNVPDLLIGAGVNRFRHAERDVEPLATAAGGGQAPSSASPNASPNASSNASPNASSSAAPGAPPRVAVDVAVRQPASAGGMYADRIHLVSTEAGVGVRIAGGGITSAGDIVVSSAGHARLGRMWTGRDVSIASAGNIHLRGPQIARRDMTVRAEGLLLHPQRLRATGNFSAYAQGLPVEDARHRPPLPQPVSSPF